MKKAIAVSLILASLMQVPKCNGAGGSGDLGHPNVSYSATPKSKQKNERGNDYPTRGTGSKKVVEFVVLLNPFRRVTITWTVDNRGNILSLEGKSWTHIDVGARSGSMVTLLVENHGLGGRTECSIYVDSKLIKPNEGDPWNPHQERDDAGDCNADILVP